MEMADKGHKHFYDWKCKVIFWKGTTLVHTMLFTNSMIKWSLSKIKTKHIGNLRCSGNGFGSGEQGKSQNDCRKRCNSKI